jgi:hypothetical protein
VLSGRVESSGEVATSYRPTAKASRRVYGPTPHGHPEFRASDLDRLDFLTLVPLTFGRMTLQTLDPII